MSKHSHNKIPGPRTLRHVILWTMVVSGVLSASWYWNTRLVQGNVSKLALRQAHQAADFDLRYRQWNASHGGVYVPITDATPPNPLLAHVETRDITTLSGRRLTLVNPAYMARQVSNSRVSDTENVYTRITSLKPLRPENAPDEWESRALRNFEENPETFSELFPNAKLPRFRLIRPIITEQPCLKCHAAQGYKLGDIRGGISVSVPMATPLAIAGQRITTITIVHAVIGVMAILGLLSWMWLIRTRDSEKARIEATLAQEREQLISIFESIDEPIHIIDPENCEVLYQNIAGKRRFGEALGSVCYYALQGLDKRCPFCTNDDIFDGTPGKTHIREHRNLITDTWFRCIEKAIRWPDGRVVRYEMAIDINERKVAEDALRESEQRFRDIANSMSNWIWETDRDGVYTYCTENVISILGYSVDEVIGRTPFDFMPAEEANRVNEIFQNLVINQERIHDLENYNLTKDGKLVCLLTNGIPKYDEQGAFLGYRGVDTDITDRKQAEEQRIQLESQIQQAQKHASLGTLAGGVAHDFNNLLVGILGNASLAYDILPEDCSERNLLKKIERAAYRAADLTKQMLAYSGKGHFVIEPVNLSKLVAEMPVLLEAAISKNAAVKYDCTDDLPLIEADATQMRQIIMNLITNASEAIGDNPGLITLRTGIMQASRAFLSTTHVDDGLPAGHYIFLEVSDTGCGMSEDTSRSIFDPFFTTKFTGRGLGLASVLGIVRGHRGALKVESELGRGTKIRILFPVPKNFIPLVAGKPSEKGQHTGKPTILIVDDEEAVRSVARMTLERSDYETICANDGREALDVFHAQSDHINAVLLDLTMPGPDGEAVFREIRHLRADIPVILSSGYNEREVTDRFQGMSYSGFLQKPYLPRHLLEHLARVLNFKPGGQMEDDRAPSATPAPARLQALATQDITKIGDYV